MLYPLILFFYYGFSNFSFFLHRSGRPSYSDSWVDQVTWMTGRFISLSYLEWVDNEQVKILHGWKKCGSWFSGSHSDESHCSLLRIDTAFLFLFFGLGRTSCWKKYLLKIMEDSPATLNNGKINLLKLIMSPKVGSDVVSCCLTSGDRYLHNQCLCFIQSSWKGDNCWSFLAGQLRGPEESSNLPKK